MPQVPEVQGMFFWFLKRPSGFLGCLDQKMIVVCADYCGAQHKPSRATFFARQELESFISSFVNVHPIVWLFLHFFPLCGDFLFRTLCMCRYCDWRPGSRWARSAHPGFKHVSYFHSRPAVSNSITRSPSCCLVFTVSWYAHHVFAVDGQGCNFPGGLINNA